MLFIDPMKRIDWGACASVCPVDAIRAEGDLPDRWDRFELMNAVLFDADCRQIAMPERFAERSPSRCPRDSETI